MQQISWVWMLQKVFQIWHVLTPFSTSEREAVKTNARWNPVTFSSKQQQAGWSTHLKRESDEKSVHLQALQTLHILYFTDVNSETETHFFLVKFLNSSSELYEPNAPSFRVFDPRGVTRINFTWQLVKFGPITVEIKLVKPIKFTLLPHVNHVYSPSDHHWLFYHVYARFNCEKN